MNNSSRVAFNTIINYSQLVLNVLVGILSVRIVLRSLGEIDYGIYNLVAGVVAIIAFISESLSQTSVRFLSVSLGKKITEHTKSIFSSCFSMHLYMALGLTIVLEIAGFVLFDGFLNIPANRVYAAKIVFQCMIATLFINVIATPFRSIIIAHEKFSYIAIIGVVESILKLLVALCVYYVICDKLILYGLLMTLISLLYLICLLFCAFYKFNIYISLHLLSIKRIKSVATFAGWTLLDVFGAIANRQGYAIMLNAFFGPETNAVFALAQHVESPLFSVSASAINSIKPQILKSYGESDVQRMTRLAFTAGKLGFSLMAMIAIPICITLPRVLDVWLGVYPPTTVFFARMMIIACLANQLTLGLATANQAYGKIKWFSIIVSSIRISALPISIVFLMFGFPAYVSMVVFAVCESLASFSRLLVMNHVAKISIRYFCKDVILRILPSVCLAIFFSILIQVQLSKNIWTLMLNIAVSAFIYAYSMYLWGLTRNELSSVKNIVSMILSKIKLAR